MAPFVYPTYENRLAGSIGDILARRGEIAAAAAQRAGVILASGAQNTGAINARGVEQAGAATARGQELSGAAWGQAAATTGAAVARMPGQMAELQAQDQQKTIREGTIAAQGQEKVLRQGEIDDKARARTDLEAIDRAYSAPGGREAILKSLTESGKGHLVPGVAKSFEEFDKSHAESRKLQEEADAAKIAAFARGGMQVREHGYDPQSAQIFLSDLKQKYANDPASLAQVQQAERALHDNPTPETVKAIIDPYLQADPKTREDLETARNHNLEDAGRKVTAAEVAKRDQATIENFQKERTQADRRLGIEQQQASTAASREKREQNIYDQTYGAGGTNPDGTPKPIPISATARAISEYKIAPPSSRSIAQGAGKALMEQVMAANPDYDATKFPERQKMRIAYTSGNQSQQLGALNTAIMHMGVLDEMAQALGNSSFKPGNEIYNKVRTIFGDSAPTNFGFARDIMSGELATAMKKSGATDTEIEKVTGALSGANSPKQLSDALRVVGIPMIAGKAQTMEEQYHATMGARDPYSVYTPSAKAVLEKLGAKSGAAAPAPGGGGKGGGPGAGAPPKEGDTKPITEPGYPPGAEMTFRGGKWIRTR